MPAVPTNTPITMPAIAPPSSEVLAGVMIESCDEGVKDEGVKDGAEGVVLSGRGVTDNRGELSHQ